MAYHSFKTKDKKEARAEKKNILTKAQSGPTIEITLFLSPNSSYLSAIKGEKIIRLENDKDKCPVVIIDCNKFWYRVPLDDIEEIWVTEISGEV